MGRRRYCVSFFRPDQVEWVDANSLEWFGDCGTYSFWQQALKEAKRRALTAGREWDGQLSGDYVSPFTPEFLRDYYAWCRRWCLEGSGRCKWVVIPDPIGTGTQELDALIREWPADLKQFGVPVYHLDEPISRAIALIRQHMREPDDPVPVICIGATGEFAAIPSEPFIERMDELFTAINAEFGFIPRVHMFRALQLFKPEFDQPIDSADSTDLGRNHNRLKDVGSVPRRKRVKGQPPSEHYLWAVRQSADRWDALAAARPELSWPPPRLIKQPSIFGEAA